MGFEAAVLEALETLVEAIGVESLLKLLFARTGKERAQEILDAEYKAADVIADVAEDEKLHGL